MDEDLKNVAHNVRLHDSVTGKAHTLITELLAELNEAHAKGAEAMTELLDMLEHRTHHLVAAMADVPPSDEGDPQPPPPAEPEEPLYGGTPPAEPGR